MAVLKLSALVDEIKGSIGGTVFQVSKYGQVAKSKSTRGPQRTPALIEQQDRVSFALSIWRGLSVADRQTWTDRAPNYPSFDRYGNTFTPTGYNLFMRVAMRLPINWIRSMTTCAGLVAGLGTWTLSDNPLPGTLRVNLTRTAASIGSDIFVEASPMYDLTITNPRKRFRRIIFLPNNLSQFTSDIASDYEAVFGPIENNKQIWIRMKAYRNVLPQASGSSEFIITTSGF